MSPRDGMLGFPDSNLGMFLSSAGQCVPSLWEHHSHLDPDPMGAGSREKPLPSLGQCFTGAHWEAEGKSTQSNDLTLSKGSCRQPDALERLRPDSLGHLWPNPQRDKSTSGRVSGQV